MKLFTRVVLIVILLGMQGFAYRLADYNPCVRSIGTENAYSKALPFIQGRGPGDQIGTTCYDYQANGSFGQRIDVDDLRQAHIDWMWQDYPGQTTRYCAWNFRYSNGAYYGEVQASNSWSGYVQMDITRDLDPNMQRTVIAYHWNAGPGYYSWIDIDAGNGWGAWGSSVTSPEVAEHIWPYVAVANNNNIILACGGQTGDSLHLYLTTNEGITWSYVLSFDSCATLSQFVRASEKRDTNKVAFVHTQFITDTIAGGQMDNDVWYVLSDDGGVTWGPHINITNYQPSDTVRAYCDVNAVFDDNDYLHIVWAGRRVDSAGYYQASKIFHWDEFNDTITVVNSPSIYYNEPGGWWIEGAAGGVGARRMPVDHPQLVSDTTNGYLYCLWHGNDDTTDVSAGGFFNGEFYAAYSSDYGITWSDYVNLTNTRTPGAGPGYCDDEDYMTACPKVVTDSIFITYVEDKDAGAGVATTPEGELTENPVRCWVFWTGLIRTGVEEDQASSSKFQEPILQIIPNPFSKLINISFGIGQRAEGQTLKIFDASGRLIKDFFLPTAYSSVPTTIKWSGTDRFDRPVPAGVYFVELTGGDESITEKVIKLR
jgi:hypothetical protein